ncbi:MAG: hypothetical protein R6W73_09055 [Candidatus Saliniplasma sp.]
MKKYVTLVGKNYWETLNSLWAVIKQDRFEPEQVYLISEKANLKRAKILKRDIGRLLSNYDLDSEVQISLAKNHDGLDLETVIKDIIDGEDKIALDITGGRKYLVAGSLVNPYSKRFDHVFYFYSGDTGDTDKPYPTIPFDDITIKDFKISTQGGEY